jgi:hypothetical protein
MCYQFFSRDDLTAPRTPSYLLSSSHITRGEQMAARRLTLGCEASCANHPGCACKEANSDHLAFCLFVSDLLSRMSHVSSSMRPIVTRKKGEWARPREMSFRKISIRSQQTRCACSAVASYLGFGTLCGSLGAHCFIFSALVPV